MLIALAASDLDAQITRRLDETSSGVQANLRSVCTSNCISQDGNLVVFSSNATNLTAHNYIGAHPNVFLKERASGAVTLVSRGVGGTGNDTANSTSNWAVLSSDGLVIAFTSAATNLGAATAGGFHIYAYDIATDTLTASPLPFANEFEPSISADGRYIAFRGNHAGLNDIYVWDRATSTVALVSITSLGTAAGSSWQPSISGDGRLIAFESNSYQLGATNIRSQIFVRDLVAQQTTMISTSQVLPGAPGDLASFAANISADGRFVAFATDATDLVAGGPGVVVFDLTTNTFQHASLAPGGGSGVPALAPSISADGRFVAYISTSEQLIAGDTNSAVDAFVHDLQTGERAITTLRNDGAQVFERYVQNVSICGPDNLVVFDSDATDLIAPDFNNNWQDVFARENPLTQLIFTTYCTAGTTTHGCVPAIWAYGNPSVSASQGFQIETASVEGEKWGLIFYGITGAIGVPWNPNSWSFSCVKAPKQRTELRFSGGTTNVCNGVLGTDWLAYLAANPTALGVPFSAGTDVWAQGWFRDPPSPGKTNLSNGLHFVTTP